MSPRTPAVVVAIAAVLVPASEASAPAKGLECVDWRAWVVYKNYGYDHWVSLESRCDRPATCRVATNVAPETITVGVAAGDRVDVLTYRGSPASEFRATVACSAD